MSSGSSITSSSTSSGTSSSLPGESPRASPTMLPRGPRVGVVTGSGGIGVLMADEAESLALEMPPLPADAQQRLVEVLPFAVPANPYDTTAQVTTRKIIRQQRIFIFVSPSLFSEKPSTRRRNPRRRNSRKSIGRALDARIRKSRLQRLAECIN